MDDPVLTYDEVSNVFAQAKGSKPEQFGNMDLRTFSRYMNKTLGTTRYKVGDSNQVTIGAMQANAGLNDLLRPASERMGEVGGDLGGLFGETGREVGQSVGQSLPRMGVDLGTFAAGAAMGPVGLPLMGTAIGSTMADTFSNTGSVPASLISGATLPAFGPAGRAVGNQAVKRLTPHVERFIGKNLPRVSEGLVREVGEQAGVAALGETSRQAQSVVQGEGFAPITARSIGENIAGNIPFLPMSVPRLARGHRVDFANARPGGEPQVMPAGFRDLVQNRGPYYLREAEARAVAGRPIAPEVAEPAAAFHDISTSVEEAKATVAASLRVTSKEEMDELKAELDVAEGHVPVKKKKMVSNLDDVLAQANKITSAETAAGGRSKAEPEIATPTTPAEVPYIDPTIPKGALVQDPLPGIIPGGQSLAKMSVRVVDKGAAYGLKKQMEEFGASVRFNKVDKDYTVEWNKPPEPKAAFLPEQLLGDTFGLVAREQLSSDKPFKMTKLPGDMLPGNDLFKRMNDMLDKDEMSLLKEAGLEAFVKGRPVGTKELDTWVAQNGPKINKTEDINDTYANRSPKPVDQMPELVTISYALQRKPNPKDPESLEMPTFPANHWKQPNTIGWFRGYMEKGAKGERVFHVVLAQSDWGQSVEKGFKGSNAVVRDYRRFLMKGAVKHAIDNGATHIAISDGNTALRAQDHDRNPMIIDRDGGTLGPTWDSPGLSKAIRENNGYYKGYTIKLPEEGGMRQAYDHDLPSIMRQLTGEQGDTVNYGKGKLSSPYGNEPAYLKNKDGTPYTDVVAATFSLDKVRTELLRRNGFTLTGRDKLVTISKSLEADGSTPEAVARALTSLKDRPRREGESIADMAAREVGLPAVIGQDVPPGEFLLKTHQFFDRYFELKGEVGERRDYLVRNAVALAARFEKTSGRTRLAEVLRGPSFHATARGGKFNALIGLRTTQVIQKREVENLRILWDFGHEMGHDIEAQIVLNPQLLVDSPLHKSYQRTLESGKVLDPIEKGNWMHGLVRHAFPGADKEFDYKGKNYEQFKNEDPNAEASEFVADLTGIYAMVASSKDARDSMADYVQFTSTDVQGYAGQTFKDINQIVAGARDYYAQQMKGLGKTDERIAETQAALDVMNTNLQDIIKGVHRGEVSNDVFKAVVDRAMNTVYDAPSVVSFKQVQGMFNIIGTPGVWAKRADVPGLNDALREAEEETKPVNHPIAGQRLNVLEKFFPATQLGESYPSMKPLIDAVADVTSTVTKSTEKMWQHFHDQNGKVDDERLRELGKSGPMRAAFDEVRLFQNASKQMFIGDNLKKFLRERGHKLNDAQIARLDLSNQQLAKVHEEGAHILIRAHLDSVYSKAALVLQSHNRTMGPKDAKRLALEIANLQLYPLTDVSPARLLEVQAQLTKKVGEKAFALVNELGMAGLKGNNIMKERLLGRPWFTSEVRPHAWMIAYQESTGDKKRHLESFRTQKEAQKRLDELRAKEAAWLKKDSTGGGASPWVYLKSFNKLDTAERWRGLQSDTIEAYRQADQALFDATMKGLEGVGDAETLNMLREEFKPGDGAYRITSPPYMLERSLMAGRESLNMIEQSMNYVDSLAFGTAKRWIKQEMQVLLNSPELRNQEALQNTLREYVSSFIDPKAREFTKMKNLVFLNFLGFNLSTSLVELTQNFLSTIPVMIKSGATIGQAYKYMLGGMAEVGQAHVKGRSFKTPDFKDEEMSRAISEAEHDRTIDRGVAQELYALEDALAVSKRNLLTGNGEKMSAKELGANAAYQMTKMARDFYSISTVFNSRMAFSGAFRFARDVKKMDYDAAYSYAKSIVRVGLFGGGRANRPTILDGWGKMQGVGGLAYSLSGYAFNTLAIYARFAKEATQGDKAAQKALATMLTSQMLVGGVMGLPLASGLIAVLEEIFPDLELKKNIRGSFTKLAGDDEKMGHTLADVGMSGMFNAALPVADVGSRFQLGSLMGVDPYNGFQSGNLGGPATGMLENIYKGTQKVAQGDYWNAAEKVAPAGMRGLIRMLGEDGGFRDEKGKLIFDATPAEQAITAIGFKPKRLNQHYEHTQLQKRSEEIAARRLDNLYQGLANKLLAGDNEGVKDGLLEEALRAREEGGAFDPKQGLARVVEVAQARSIPIDASRTGLQRNTQERASIAGMYPRAQAPSEIRRYLERKGLERQVGIQGAGRPSPTGIRNAQMIDRLVAQGVSYAQAKTMVEQRLSQPTL